MGYEKREENYQQLNYNNPSNPNQVNTSNGAFEDPFYIDSVERYNVKYKAPPAAVNNNAAGSPL